MDDFEAQWARCEHWIEGALAYTDGLYEIGDVKALVEQGEATFWPGKECACVSQWLFFPRKRVLNYWLAGGSMGELLNQMMPAIERWAIENFDCISFSVCGRPGWQRAMARYGFKPQWQVLTRDIPLSSADQGTLN